MPFYGYDENKKDFSWYDSYTNWETKLTPNGASEYVQHHLKQSLINDFVPAFDEYKKRGHIGFFACLRIVFPYIDFMGALYTGCNKSKDAIEYIRDYLGQIDVRYQKYGDLMYWCFRHGLLHTNMPLSFEIGGVSVGWIVFLDGDHLELSSPIDSSIRFTISCKQLFDDICSSMDIYMNDLRMKKGNLLANFKKGFKIMAETCKEIDITGCDVGISNFKKYIEEDENFTKVQKYYIDR